MASAIKNEPAEAETSRSDLPEGWTKAPLGEAATLQRGFDLPAHQRKPGAIAVWAANGPVGFHNIASVKGPGVVTGRSGTIGKVHFVESDFWPLNTALYVKDFHGNDPKFVAFLLQNFGLEQYHAGTGVPTLNRNVVHKIPIALPPLEEQMRIAKKIDSLHARVKIASEHLVKVPKILRAFRQSVLAAACSGRLTEDLGSSEWRELVMEDLAVEIRTGPFGSSLHKSDYVSGGTPVINPVNIANGKIVPSENVSISPSTCRRLADYALKEGDVILARRGEMGRCAVVARREHGWLCGTGSAILRLKQDVIPEFMQIWISSPNGRAYLSQGSVGSTMDNLNQKLFASMPVSLPVKTEQREIIRRVEVLFKLADKIDRRIEGATKRADRLTQAVLAKAFRGELVQTEAELARREGRTYETAEQLLARIENRQTDRAAVRRASQNGARCHAGQ